MVLPFRKLLKAFMIAVLFIKCIMSSLHNHVVLPCSLLWCRHCAGHLKQQQVSSEQPTHLPCRQQQQQQQAQQQEQLAMLPTQQQLGQQQQQGHLVTVGS